MVAEVSWLCDAFIFYSCAGRGTQHHVPRVRMMNDTLRYANIHQANYEKKKKTPPDIEIPMKDEIIIINE